jgi:thiol-disulfide isomerase/thioredoxin
MFRMLLIAAVTCTAFSTMTAKAADPPADRVVAMYFHRTERCPTCKMMGSYAEEAVKSGFASQLKKGTVEFRYIDFQQPKNANLAKAYKVTGPALIVAKVADNKVSKYNDLKEIWVKVREKTQFIKYVQDNVRAYVD